MGPHLDVLFQDAILSKSLTLTVCDNSAQIQIQVEHSTYTFASHFNRKWLKGTCCCLISNRHKLCLSLQKGKRIDEHTLWSALFLDPCPEIRSGNTRQFQWFTGKIQIHIFPLHSFLCLQHIQLSNFSGASCGKLVLPDCIPGVNRKQSTAQHTAHCWTDSKAGEVKEKILPDSGEIQRGSGRLSVKINGNKKNQSSLSNTERKRNLAKALCSTLSTLTLFGDWRASCRATPRLQYTQ